MKSQPISYNAALKGCGTILADEKAILTDGSSSVRLDNLHLDAHERFPVDVTFDLRPNIPIPDLSFDFFLQQFWQSGDKPDSLLALDKVYGAVGLKVITGSGEAARPANALDVANTTSTENALVLYPNPTGDVLKATYPALQGAAMLSVYDITGRVMQTRIAEKSGLTELDMRGYVPGIYIVELRSTDGQIMRKRFTKK